jgi:hypothetical protein
MASLLLDADEGTLVSLELIDDVGVENRDNTKVASQTKSVRKTNPVSDRSPELWKSFANWSRDVRSGALDATRTTFELYTSRTVSSKLAQKFGQVSNGDQAIAAFEEARERLWGKPPKFSERSHVAQNLAPHLEEVFGQGKAAFQSILPRFRLRSGTGSPIEDLHRQFERLVVKRAIVPDLVAHMHGWLKQRIDTQLEKGRAPVISREEFFQEMLAYVGRIDSAGALPDLATNKPTPEQILALMPLPFVQQLKLIEIDSASLTNAITAFFKASHVRTRWGEEALLHDPMLTELEENLLQVWRNHKQLMSTDPLLTDELQRGRRLQAQCDLHRCKIERKEVPEYFIPGCFHTLADQLRLGWHPRYETLLASKAA